MKVTLKEIEDLETGNGGYSKRVLALFDIKWPPKKGWKKRVVGMEINRGKYLAVLADVKLKKNV